MPKSQMFITVSKTRKSRLAPLDKGGWVGMSTQGAATKAQDATPRPRQEKGARPPARRKEGKNPTLLTPD